ncbi:hypothetical protein [Phyllobacterium sp. OV277]|uniref:hypothetical protein n=1 Tax=Phyllobacterium sp. OV277 TaxID=1882772 RepID=UPI000884F9B2|nr:hypothetical protein [Phyllobacterium sp. OV277]SDP09222.1 hypothetical protein SAMN05443582_103378 [Phyllobacterium sp. OV277]
MAPKKKPTDQLKDQRIPIMMTPSEVEAIDDWMFKNRIRSRGEAIRRLCQMAIAVDAKADPILKQVMAILRRRIEDGRIDRSKVDRGNLDFIRFSLAALTAIKEGLEDHSRLLLAIVGLFGPLRAMRDEPELEDALRAATTAREGMDTILSDLAILENPTREIKD